MLERRALVFATAVGTAFQLAMVILGHSDPAIARYFAFGGMTLSLVAGLIYAWRAGTDSRQALGGMIAGGLCAFLGILLSWGLGDVTGSVLLFGTVSSMITGAIGGWLGRVLPRGSSAGTAGGTGA